MPLTRILIASPVRQKPAILEQFLASIKRLRHSGLDLACAFIDDNVDPESSRLLAEFDFHGECTIIKADTTTKGSEYIQDDLTHHWKEDLIWKVAAFKDRLIELALDRGMDHLFLVDSDLVLSPQTLEHLVACDKEVVCEVYWTSWQPDKLQMPQVWAQGQYEIVKRRREEKLSDADVQMRTQEFIRNAYQPNLQQVGGLGACTLIQRSALLKGVRFAEIDNLTYWGEDRHFCVRARALGVELWADGTFPPLHIYRESDLGRVNDFIEWAQRDRWVKPHITLSMVVRNESGRFLEKMLLQHRSAIDAAVIIDDASEDDTTEIIKRCLSGIPLKLVQNRESKFHNEFELRKQQWDETVATHPDWILNLDADEILQDNCAQGLRVVAQQTRYRYVGFNLYDMWDEHRYRDDPLWTAHKRSWGFMFRYTPFFNYSWQQTAQHCGRFPRNLDFFKLARCDLRVKHMGWSREEDRLAKWKRYMELDPQGRFGSLPQYQSILDPTPHLVAF